MSKCLRCGAGPEWLQGKIPSEPTPAMSQSQNTDDARGALRDAGWLESEILQLLPLEPSGQAVDRQEWTLAYCIQLIRDLPEIAAAMNVRDAHNATLAAEREKTTEACKATFGVNQAWQDRFDLLRDEFLRIIACPGVTNEITGICERAEKDIRRNVPLIEELAAERSFTDAMWDRRHELAAEVTKLHQQLAAERQRAELAERASQEWQKAAKQINGGKWISPSDLVTLVLSALAAIEKAKAVLRQVYHDGTVGETVEAMVRFIESEPLSLLNQHDAALRAQWEKEHEHSQ